MLRRTSMRQIRPAFPPKLRDREPAEPLTVKPLVRGSYGPCEGGGAVPKPEALRNRRLLDLARGMPCLLRIPGVCNHDSTTTVACHSNLGIHGKAGARKADDCYSVWGCSACHRWMDQGRAPADVKALAFTLAHIDQVQAWRLIATDAARPEADRRAARWALDLLQTTPVGDLQL
jgi:hypothetical protein